MSIHEPILNQRRTLRMTEEEFVAWCDEDVKAEWVDGEVIIMAPSSSGHVDLNGWLMSVFREFAEQHDLGKVYGPELMIRFARRRRRRVPDLLFIAKDRTSIIRKNHVEGSPDLVLEIVSPDSVSRDWREKYIDYEKAGVREYWVVSPDESVIEAYSLNTKGEYDLIPETNGKIASKIIPKFYLRPTWLWQNPLPKLASIRKEFGI